MANCTELERAHLDQHKTTSVEYLGCKNALLGWAGLEIGSRREGGELINTRWGEGGELINTQWGEEGELINTQWGEGGELINTKRAACFLPLARWALRLLTQRLMNKYPTIS